jgi:hypothetical protein
MNPEQTPAIEFRNVSISFDGAQALLHPMTEATHGELDIDDPWRQNRKTKRSPDITVPSDCAAGDQVITATGHYLNRTD